MPRSWQYPRWRRILMQCVMWLVLGAAVGAAAFINHEMGRRHRAILDAPRTLGELRIRLPRGWTTDSNSSNASILAHLSEPGDWPGARQLLILSRSTEGFIPPMQCLARLNGGVPKGSAAQVREIDMAGYPGVLVRRRVRVGETSEASIVQACVSFPWRQALVIHMEAIGPLDQSDLVERIAASVAWEGRTAIGDGKSLIFPHVSVPVPQGWRVAGENDPNRAARQLLYAAGGTWISAEVIPCYLPDDRAPSVLALVAANDADWLDAAITAQAGQWQLDLAPDRKDGLVQARVLSTQAKRGLIVIFRGMLSDQAEVDRAWQAMTQGALFKKTKDWDQLLAAGAQTAAKWAASPPDQLLPTREDQWWLWHRPAATPYMGWMNLQWLSAAGGEDQAPSPWRAVWEMRWREADGAVSRLRRKAQGTDANYASDMELWRSNEGTGSFIPVERQGIAVHDGVLINASAAGRTQTRVPPQFVGGSWLPLLLPQTDRMMVLKTESVLCQPSHGTLLDVIVQPAPPAAAATTTKTGEQGQTFIVQINGSGDRMRWSFGSDGALQSVDCARGLRLLAASPQDLRLDFHDEARLSP